jgi:hypothetical protein
MAPTRSQTTAAGAFDAQMAVERLEAEITEIRGNIAELKQSTAGISDIQQKMVTVDTLDAILQKYLTIQPSTSGVTQLGTEGTAPSLQPQSCMTNSSSHRYQ